MDNINNLQDLFLRLLHDLRCAENKISANMPALIEKAQHRSLANALKHHYEQTGNQVARLDKIIISIQTNIKDNSSCKAVNGLLEEINDLMESNLAKEVTDAAIIASVQKIEHYEICTYGTALAYAEHLHLHEAAVLLEETLNEEYDVDDLLTALATSALNKEALPGDFDTTEEDQTAPMQVVENAHSGKVIINERTIKSPGGRAGRSHRGYSSGESRGH